jgi:diaminopimelate epimerase
LPDGTLKIRTFEKGVEGETLACGTGITAAAIAAWAATDAKGHGRISIRLQARRGDLLSVDFVPSESKADSFREIHLTGPAEFV